MSESISPFEDQHPEPFECIVEDGEARFSFTLVPCTSESGQRYYEIDVVEQPGYGERDEAGSKTHKRNSPRGGEMVCIGDYPASCPTIEEAQRWASMWAKLTWRYIKAGVEFPE